ncbi:unnamed protein product [Pedinophyceae sp. YPF-701]|nr:unnamed protein product [Pedinophyceae sp. YPF-701]
MHTPALMNRVASTASAPHTGIHGPTHRYPGFTRPAVPRQAVAAKATEAETANGAAPPVPARGFTRKDLLDYVYENSPHQISKADCSDIVDLVFEGVINAVVQGGRITIPGFGTFAARDRKERQGRNPRTGEPLTIPAKRVAAFKAGAAFSDAVESGEAAELL